MQTITAACIVALAIALPMPSGGNDLGHLEVNDAEDLVPEDGWEGDPMFGSLSTTTKQMFPPNDWPKHDKLDTLKSEARAHKKPTKQTKQLNRFFGYKQMRNDWPKHDKLDALSETHHHQQHAAHKPAAHKIKQLIGTNQMPNDQPKHDKLNDSTTHKKPMKPFHVNRHRRVVAVKNDLPNAKNTDSTIPMINKLAAEGVHQLAAQGIRKLDAESHSVEQLMHEEQDSLQHKKSWIPPTHEEQDSLEHEKSWIPPTQWD